MLQPRSVTIFNGGPALNQEGPQDSVKFPKFEKFEGGGRIREFEREFERGRIREFEREFEGGG